MKRNSDAEEALRVSKARFRLIFEGAAVGIAILDQSGHLYDANSSFRTMFGDDITTLIQGHEQDLAEVLAARRMTFEFKQYGQTLSGAYVWINATVSAVQATGDAPVFAICIFRHRTSLNGAPYVAHANTHDMLTGLLDRHSFREQLRRCLSGSDAARDLACAVMFVKLKHYKSVNEELGSLVGDVLLVQTSRRLRASLDERFILSRLSKGEFAILVAPLGDIDLDSTAVQIESDLSKQIIVESRSIYLGARVGAAVGSGNCSTAGEMMHNADLALRYAISGDTARYAIWNPIMHEREQRRSLLRSDMGVAIERKEFRLFYQAIIDLSTGDLVGCEALLRWDHPTQGMIDPNEFIPLAEQSGFAPAIGRFVQQSAISQFSAWGRNRQNCGNFTMHLNVSACELSDPEYANGLLQCAQEHDIAPRDVMLEITESISLDSVSGVHAILRQIRAQGFQMCIDDFGTGYSSIRYLQQFKIDAIKLDRGFLPGSDAHHASEPIGRTVMALANAYEVQVVAEGVETAGQREWLRSIGCRRAQGFIFSYPVPPAQFVALYPDVLRRADFQS